MRNMQTEGGGGGGGGGVGLREIWEKDKDDARVK